ncbi:hypothetical protein A4X13_0g4342 [Tilletia indica]|uniref:Uncharacterized protein n=1 Tax=Tilletia indica TaxID=43049 RepID=A0A177TD55_9BASI|nr:hypothetical protein A4X13_0g4342 [Tilletia indica]
MGLNGEILQNIIAFAMLPDDPATETLVRYIIRSRQLHLVNKFFNQFTRRTVGLHVHTSAPLWSPAARVDLGPWHPSASASVHTHNKYWVHHHRFQLPIRADWVFIDTYLSTARLPKLRSLTLDLWTGLPGTPSVPARWTESATTYISAVEALLDRIECTAFGIEDIHVRLPCHQPAIDSMHRIIANQYNLRRVRIEVETSSYTRTPRPRFNLDNMATARVKYAPLQTFIIRAPTCDIHFMKAPDSQTAFFDRVAPLYEFGIACSAFATYYPAWVWLHHLLRRTTRLELCEFNVSETDDRVVDPARFNLRPMNLPRLWGLTLQIPTVDSHILQHMSAPMLHYLRIRSSVDVELWPNCPHEHFPRLKLVSVKFPGPSILRLHALGIAFERFIHNMTGVHDWDTEHCAEFAAFIKPYNRPGRTTPYGEPYSRPPPLPHTLHPSASLALIALPSSPSSDALAPTNTSNICNHLPNKRPRLH